MGMPMNAGITDAGAVTWGSGTAGVAGPISSSSSLVGTTANDNVGTSVTALSNGNSAVRSPNWDQGTLADAGAATRGSGTTGIAGSVSSTNSLVGTITTPLTFIVADDVNGNFIARWLSEGGGRVRVGPVVDPTPAIVSAVDIPNDQGGWLRLTFTRSLHDVTGSPTPAASYGVWRHIPGTVPARIQAATRADVAGADPPRDAIPAGLDVVEVEGHVYLASDGGLATASAASFPPGTWELVASVPAFKQPQYVVAAPTISNATADDFVVSAHATSPVPALLSVSAIASAQSIDNLAPAPPTGLTASYAGGQTSLLWTPNTENDLGSYRVYRGTSAGFTPSGGNLIGSPTSPGFADVGAPGGYYKVSAVDVNGNESGYTLITPDGTTSVDAETPVAFALERIRPNPASGRDLRVAFALPNGSSARLDLLDLGGRRVTTREVGSLGRGRHTVNLAEGRPVASGLYWVRLTQGEVRRTTRVAVVE